MCIRDRHPQRRAHDLPPRRSGVPGGLAGYRQIPNGAELRRGICLRAAEHRCQHHSGYRCRGHDLQHFNRRRNARAADHVCNRLCQYACDLTENEEESSMKNIVDAAAFYKAMTALMEVPSKSSIEVLRDRKSTRLNSSHSDRSRMPSSA